MAIFSLPSAVITFTHLSSCWGCAVKPQTPRSEDQTVCESWPRASHFRRQATTLAHRRYCCSESFSKIVTSFTLSGTRVPAVDAAAGVRDVLDVPDLIGLVFRSDHGDRQFALGTIASLHNFRNPEPAVLSGYVRLQSIGRWFHRRQCWGRLMRQRKMV